MSESSTTESACALQVRIEAKPETVEEVTEFLTSARSLAADEDGTTTWFASQVDETTFEIFDTFPDEDARQAHLDGEIAEQLLAKADELLASEPQIEERDVLAATHP